MSKLRGTGQGCWASHKTIAQEANVNYTNLSVLIGELIGWGYIAGEHRPLNRRMRVYRVEYDSLPTGKHSAGDAPPEGLPLADQKVGIVCPKGNFSEQNQRDNHAEYIQKKNIDIEVSRERYPAEAAPPLRVGEGLRKRVCRNPSATLVIIENALASGSCFDADTRRAVCQILDEHHDDQAVRDQAQRILKTYG